MDSQRLINSILYIFCVACVWCLTADEKRKFRIFYSLVPLVFVVNLVGREALSLTRQILLFLKERKRFENELPQFIDSVRSCLKAGLCLDNALQYTLSQPKWGNVLTARMGSIVAEREAGRSMEECLWAARKGVADDPFGRYMNVFLTSLHIGYLSGGDLVKLLEKCQRKVLTALDLKRKIRVVTAQMRFQSLVVALAPFALGVILYIFDPSRVTFFFTDNLGRFLFVLVIALCSTGLYFLNKLGTVDV